MAKESLRIVGQDEGAKPSSVESRERGVKNPKIIDLISPSSFDESVELTVWEERSCSPGSDQEALQLTQLEEKLNNYLGYLLDGYFEREYPQYRGKAVRVVFEYTGTMSERYDRFLTAFEQYLKSTPISWERRRIEECDREVIGE